MTRIVLMTEEGGHIFRTREDAAELLADIYEAEPDAIVPAMIRPSDKEAIVDMAHDLIVARRVERWAAGEEVD